MYMCIDFVVSGQVSYLSPVGKSYRENGEALDHSEKWISIPQINTVDVGKRFLRSKHFFLNCDLATLNCTIFNLNILQEGIH